MPAEKSITAWFGGSGVVPATPTPSGPPPLTPSGPPPTPGAGPTPIPQPIPPGPPRAAPAPGTAGVDNPAFNRVASPGPNTDQQVYFPQTGHTLAAEFLAYWRAHGGLAQFGYPVSEPYQELNPTDGKAYVVQYFERQRFEYHSEAAGTPAAVQLGRLGAEMAPSAAMSR